MNNKFTYMLITNDRDISHYAYECGIGRIFIDLEINGKYERQGHLDTVISQHSLEDIRIIRESAPNSEILVRINPYYGKTKYEIDKAIEFGADIIMLPMFESAEEVISVGKLINHRAKFIPLIETKSAAEDLPNYVHSSFVSELYIGLNDLHRSLGYTFMFEPLATGYIDSLVVEIKNANKPFGFGGIAKLGEGTLPARAILAEHVRLGSSSVILSRAFHERSESLTELKSKINLREEICKLNNEIRNLTSRGKQEIIADNLYLKKIVNSIVSKKS